MQGYSTELLRNVALISHGGAGKTSLTEAMLYTSGVTNRLGSVEAGNTVTDYDPDEIDRQITISTSLAPLDWNGTKINLLDTPGFFDFLGDAKSSLRVVESAVVVVCAVNKVEVGTEMVWSFADELNLPRAVFINKLNRENADYDVTLEQLREFFGVKVFPLQIPIGQEQSFRGIIDLVKMKALLYEEGNSSPKEEEIPADMQDKVDEMREKLIEAAAESNDELMEKYLEEESLSNDEILTALRSGVLEGKIVPVLCGASNINAGIHPLLDFIKESFPSPIDRGPEKGSDSGSEEEIERNPSVNEPLSALVFKTLTDPYVGRVNFVRVFSGVLKSDAQVYNARQDKMERIGNLYFMRGKNQEPAGEIPAGDIGALTKLSATVTSDTLCDKSNPIIYPPIKFPEPVISFAVETKAKGDEEKVGTGLSRFLEEDPSFRVERNSETKELLISGLGDTHLDVIVQRLAKKFGVEVELKTPKVPYKETIKKTAKKENKYKKQSGGRGQYGHVFLEISPMERGEGFVFEDKIVGGVVPKQYIPAVEKGVWDTMQEGILAGYPVVDVKVTLYDGSYHPVDSAEMPFKIAGSQAFRGAMEHADPVLLEPIMDVEVTVPESYMGDIMGDINSRRGRIQGMEPGQGVQTIKAKVPLAEMFNYAIDLRSMTQGRAYFKMEFSHYEEVPPQESEKIIATAKEEKEKEK